MQEVIDVGAPGVNESDDIKFGIGIGGFQVELFLEGAKGQITPGNGDAGHRGELVGAFDSGGGELGRGAAANQEFELRAVVGFAGIQAEGGWIHVVLGADGGERQGEEKNECQET